MDKSFIAEITMELSKELNLGKKATYLIFNSLKNLDFRDSYSDILKQKLKKHLKSMFLEPGTRIGTISAQSIMHGATQSELSAFHLSDTEETQGLMTISIEDVLNMSNSKSLSCFFYPPEQSYKKCVEMRSKIGSITFSELIEDYEMYSETLKLEKLITEKMFFNLSETSYPFRKVIKLKKHLLSMYDLKMRDIEKYLFQYNNLIVSFVTSECLARVLIRSASLINIAEFSRKASKILINPEKKITDITIVKINREWVLTSGSKNLSYIISCNVADRLKTFCNDIEVVANVYGICACRDIIYESLNATNSFNESFSLLVADYMTWSGYPRPFTKSGIVGDFGKLFEMYFEKPKETLTDWALNPTEDNLNNPYSQLMCGNLKNEFEIYDNCYSKVK